MINGVSLYSLSETPNKPIYFSRWSFVIQIRVTPLSIYICWFFNQTMQLYSGHVI